MKSPICSGTGVVFCTYHSFIMATMYLPSLAVTIPMSMPLKHEPGASSSFLYYPYYCLQAQQNDITHECIIVSPSLLCSILGWLFSTCGP